MRRLEGALRSYAWGSRTAIAELCGRPVPSDHPEAELWLGAHPADPAKVLSEDGEAPVSLLDVVESDPHGQLGSGTVDRFGARLPFLLKLLAAEEPLSLQAHPSAEQAAQGYAREQELGVPLDSPIRNYRDPNHKPELVVALTRFEALAGFRDAARTVELLEALGVPELDPYVGLLAGQPDSGGLRALFTTWITLPQPVLTSLLPRVLDGCVTYLATNGRPRVFAEEVRTALQLAEFYPGDAGVLASLLLNRITLEPGQGLYLDAGNLHAYLSGMGVEIMANSDNVLRGGLTPKHVDVPELLRVLDFRSPDVPILEAVPVGEAEVCYRTPAPEFALSRLEPEPHTKVSLAPCGPQILLCTAGAAHLDCGGAGLDLTPGHSVWISAADPELTVEALTAGTQVFRACLGDRSAL
ncbi:mannose-6-phosphate isomerase, class I [Rhodococcus sp. NPDC003382]|uniref:mannose-6-phosphate isomerase, class I n=1 Tax=unclassified Rhodococcus (in: high G+C Gram-positive bacteria) TaxID=192944 RepID=UPI0018CD5039|nr:MULTISPECIES: mannose-6-phosphate isomerase, class I [unclassified Rhodococcus (in: high G+C Gram-positive bacteria)]MBH0120840.1 mannose-6-phosphate isomerase, class I [Rhodococcus sp. CX]MCK8670069.1 mannose-6-phosphate isomerase, class I [Rhodococcus sp. HM1]